MKVTTETLHRVFYTCYLRFHEITWNSLIVYSSLSNLLDTFDFTIHVELVTYCMIILNYFINIMLLSSQTYTLSDITVYEQIFVRAYAWKFAFFCILSYVYCTSCVISLYVCVKESICMIACMFVYLVLYILSYISCYFIIDVCQREHLYESFCVLSCIYCRTSYVISLCL